MTTELTDQEAQKLFNATSAAIRDNDTEKLDNLAVAPTTEIKEEVTPPVNPPLEKAEDVDDKDKDTTPPLDDKTPAEKKDDEENKDTPAEKTELEKLQETLATLSKENHALRSQAGRVPHVQRRLQELDKKLEELNKAHTSPSSQPSAKVTAKVEEILKGIKETDPELAKAVALAIASATDEVAGDVTSREIASLQSQRETELSQYRDAEAQRFLEMYPNAAEVVKAPSWIEWESKQSPGIRKLCGSDNADDLSYAFEKYAADMVKQHPELAAKVGTPPAPDAAAAEASEKAKQVEAERLRKKETAANISSPAGAGKVTLPDDPAALFKKYSEEIRKERTG